MTPLKPGATIGILGGGQLGRLMALEAAKFGFDVHIYCPEPRGPAARVAAFETVADYDDTSALEQFAVGCDVVTYEFENVPAETVRILEAAGTQVRPRETSLEVAQDRVVEKTFLNDLGIETVAFRAVGSVNDLEAGLADFGRRAILKTRHDGYDGKGQVRVQGQEGLAEARALAAEAPCILESFALFEREISVVVARNEMQVLAYDPSENIHENGILTRALAPANISDEIAARAIEAGTGLADALGHIGVLALELFVMPDGSLLANEFAPRVHNSGHWTPEACLTGQFEQHIRAVAGWPLGPVTRLFDCEMENLIGEDILHVPDAFDGEVRLVSYGKAAPRPGRKMGHLTRLAQKKS